MAQDTEETGAEETSSQDPTQLPVEDHNENLHYYSGGEIKELANSQITPVLTWFWVILIAVCVFSMFYFGVIRHFGTYKPEWGSEANMQQIQQQLNTEDVTNGQTNIDVLDINRLYRPQGQTVDQAIAAGQTVYQNNCVGCHGPNQDGNGINAEDLNPKPRNFHDAPFMQALSYQRINTSVHKGVPGTAMPRWENTLTSDQIADVIIYVLSLTSPPPGGAPAAATSSLPAAPVSGFQARYNPSFNINGMTAFAPHGHANITHAGAA